MFKNILIPLDGSKLAEAALSPAESLAKTLNAPITLIHIIEKDAPQVIHSDHHLSRVDEADEYLRHIAENTFPGDIKIETHVHTAQVKDVAASIIQHSTEEFNPDLIVMCAHGSSGIRDFVFGNIAQQVVAGGKTPLLLIQPQSTNNQPFTLRRIFVPLDSESKHDESLHFAIGLAKAYDAEIYLLTVVPTIGTLSGQDAAVSTMLPATAIAFLDFKEETTKEHLQTHLTEILDAGIRAKAEIARGDAAEMIATTAARVEADLILLATHRRAGMGAFWARSVAPDVVRKSHLPVLLVPVKE
ncbi:MAG TPA: universal stress protein [Prolixibacteraceae bacterium]|jgi:nucleotide-binding universal stress UspA family protein